MDRPLLTRRTMLVRALKFGSAAAVAAAIGCDLEAAPGPAPSPPEDVAPPAVSPTAAPYVAPTRTPTPAPAEIRLDLMPTTMSIPALGIEVPVDPAQTVPTANGGYEILVPDSGVVSPNHVIGDKSVNNVWILGHSRWRRVPQLLYTTANLNPSDSITLAGRDLATGREIAGLTFEVDRLILADVEFAGREIYEAPRTVPRLIIQTSVRQLYDPEWILDRATLEAKADVAVTTSVDDLSRYLLLLIVATVQEETLAALLANT